MEERDDLEQMAFIQKWNDGKTEREKKREQMWNGILAVSYTHLRAHET